MGDMFLSNSLIKKIIFWVYCKILINAKIIICQNIEDQKYFVKKNNKLKKKNKSNFWLWN